MPQRRPAGPPTRPASSGHGRRQSRGQIAPVALFGILIASAILVTMFNTGQKITEKSQVANAADAAAYSGAVWTARHLNFMAYTNRAMVANHIGVGHFVSYVSWVRYIEGTIDFIDNFTQFIPYASQYVDIVQNILEEVRDFTEESAEIAVPMIDIWNASYRAAQVETQASLALNNLTDVMRETARAHDPAIRINERDDFNGMPNELRVLIEAQLLSQLASVPTFVERYSADEDDGSISEVIAGSMRTHVDTNRWIADRSWRFDTFSRDFRKQGGTKHSQSEDSADWEASDRIQTRKRQLFGHSKWANIGPTAEASASEFYDDYSGVPNYYNLDGSPGDRSLRIAAVATRAASSVAARSFKGVISTNDFLAASAVARVEFKRPSGSAFTSLGKAQEYSNLFNPFWEARLTATDLGLGI